MSSAWLPKLGSLLMLIKEQKQTSFVDHKRATDEEALGILISRFCEWDGQAIFEVTKAAFEDANFHTWVELLEKEWADFDEDKIEPQGSDVKSYVVVNDTLCEGWQAWGEASGEVEVFDSEAAARQEIQDVFEELVQNQIASGMEPDDEPSEFVVPLDEYVKGRKTIYTGETNEE